MAQMEPKNDQRDSFRDESHPFNSEESIKELAKTLEDLHPEFQIEEKVRGELVMRKKNAENLLQTLRETQYRVKDEVWNGKIKKFKRDLEDKQEEYIEEESNRGKSSKGSSKKKGNKPDFTLDTKLPYHGIRNHGLWYDSREYKSKGGLPKELQEENKKFEQYWFMPKFDHNNNVVESYDCGSGDKHGESPQYWMIRTGYPAFKNYSRDQAELNYLEDFEKYMTKARGEEFLMNFLILYEKYIKTEVINLDAIEFRVLKIHYDVIKSNPQIKSDIQSFQDIEKKKKQEREATQKLIEEMKDRVESLFKDSKGDPYEQTKEIQRLNKKIEQLERQSDQLGVAVLKSIQLQDDPSSSPSGYYHSTQWRHNSGAVGEKRRSQFYPSYRRRRTPTSNTIRGVRLLNDIKNGQTSIVEMDSNGDYWC